jgi:hypothetical protein
VTGASGCSALHGERDLTTMPSLRSKLERAALAYGRDQAVEHEEHVLAVVVPSSGVARRLLPLTGLDTVNRPSSRRVTLPSPRFGQG